MDWSRILRTLRHSRMVQWGAAGIVVVLIAWLASGRTAANPEYWQRYWPKTDFTNHSVALEEIVSGGPPKDGIPAIDDPQFVPVGESARLGIGDTEPVITVAIGEDLRAYPLRVLMWHEIVNDTVGGVPVSVTYCPLCNSAVVFDRRLGTQVLDFGTTGKLRRSDMVMYDRQTESWWQQFLGEAIVGELTGARLKVLPARMESFTRFRARGDQGKVLVPNIPGMRSYGRNPYAHYDSQPGPIPGFFTGSLPTKVAPMERVVVIGDEAWAFSLLREKGTIIRGDLVITWEPGQSSALDDAVIADGRDVGNVVVQRKGAGGLKDVAHDVSFAFAFHAFKPHGVIHAE